MNQTATPTETEKYYFVFYGHAPSIMMARVAYRRVKGSQPTPRLRHERKLIRCPHCAEPLTDIDIDAKVELHRYPAEKHIRCQVYPVCQKCKNEIGMILVS